MSNSKKLLQAAEKLVKAKADLEKLLADSEFTHIQISVANALDQLINRLYFLGGGQAPTKASTEFPPITNFMGEDITVPKAVNLEELDPSEAEKALFVDKVNKLYDLIDTAAPEGILNDYRIPEDVLVLRGVAKKAGVDGYQDRELNVAFIEAIVKGKQDKAKAAQEQLNIEAELQKQEKITDLNRRISEGQLRITSIQEDIQLTKLDLDKASNNSQKDKLRKALEALNSDLAEGEKALNELEVELANLTQQ